MDAAKVSRWKAAIQPPPAETPA